MQCYLANKLVVTLASKDIIDTVLNCALYKCKIPSSSVLYVSNYLQDESLTLDTRRNETNRIRCLPAVQLYLNDCHYLSRTQRPCSSKLTPYTYTHTHTNTHTHRHIDMNMSGSACKEDSEDLHSSHARK